MHGLRYYSVASRIPPGRVLLGSSLPRSWSYNIFLKDVVIVSGCVCVCVCVFVGVFLMVSQSRPKMSKDGPKRAPREPTMDPRWVPDAPREPQEGLKKPKMGPRWAQVAPKMDPKSHQNRSSELLEHRSRKRECPSHFFGPVLDPCWPLWETPKTS